MARRFGRRGSRARAGEVGIRARPSARDVRCADGGRTDDVQTRLRELGRRWVIIAWASRWTPLTHAMRNMMHVRRRDRHERAPPVVTVPAAMAIAGPDR